MTDKAETGPDGQGEPAIEIERDETVIAAAYVVGAFLERLQLPTAQHNQLITLILVQIAAAEKCAFAQGFVIGREYGRSETLRQARASKERKLTQ